MAFCLDQKLLQMTLINFFESLQMLTTIYIYIYIYIYGSLLL